MNLCSTNTHTNTHTPMSFFLSRMFVLFCLLFLILSPMSVFFFVSVRFLTPKHPNTQTPKWSCPHLAKWHWARSVLGVLAMCVSRFWVGVFKILGPLRWRTPPPILLRRRAPSPGPPKISRFFFLSRRKFHSFFSLWGVFSLIFGGFLKAGTLKCARLGSRAVL